MSAPENKSRVDCGRDRLDIGPSDAISIQKSELASSGIELDHRTGRSLFCMLMRQSSAVCLWLLIATQGRSSHVMEKGMQFF